MRKTLVVLAWLVTAAGAGATVRVFVTGSSSGYGLEDNANAFLPTVSTVYANGVTENGYDYWADWYGEIPGPIRPGAFPPADSPTGTPDSPVLIAAGDFAYIWLQFQNEPKGAKINGLQVTVREYGSTLPASVSTTYYLCNNESNIILSKRWEGTATPPGYLEWHNNPQTTVAITAQGLVNTGTSSAWNLWDGTSRIALLGALAAAEPSTLYELAVTNISYNSGQPPADEHGYFMFVPEPASALLLASAGLLLRRR